MNNLLLRLSYDGTNFHGWQFQKTGERTVEGVLEAVWKIIAKDERTRFICSGRTDSRVHALEQAVNFLTAREISPAGLKKAFNALLPSDVYVHSVLNVPLNFHARYCAFERTYLYKISKKYSIFDRFYAYYHRLPLNISQMSQAGLFLLGEQDFSAFRASGCSSPTPIRTLKEIIITEDEHYYYFEFTANAYLFRMVRNMMGTLLAVGDGQLTPQDVKTILASKDRNTAPKIAPPQGLYLKNVKYKDDFGRP